MARNGRASPNAMAPCALHRRQASVGSPRRRGALLRPSRRCRPPRRPRPLVAPSRAMAIIGVLILVSLYFVPTIVGVIRKVPNIGSIGVINFFLGWSIIGWVIALAMA